MPSCNPARHRARAPQSARRATPPSGARRARGRPEALLDVSLEGLFCATHGTVESASRVPNISRPGIAPCRPHHSLVPAAGASRDASANVTSARIAITGATGPSAQWSRTPSRPMATTSSAWLAVRPTHQTALGTCPRARSTSTRSARWTPSCTSQENVGRPLTSARKHGSTRPAPRLRALRGRSQRWTNRRR